jgi:transcriptional regulator with XRE-family HTH domain
MQTELATLVPARRLGSLLREARIAKGLGLEDIAAHHPEFTVVDIDDLELGRRSLNDSQLKKIISAYGLDEANLLPTRSKLVIDLDEGRMAVEESEVSTDGLSGPDEILARYLAFVYHLRNMPVGSPIPLRDVDLEVLSTALEIETIDIEERLKRLMTDEEAIAKSQQRFRGRVLLPLAGVVLAACSAGVLVFVASSNDAVQPNATSTQTDVSMPAIAAPSVVTDIGTGGAVVIAASVETQLGSAVVAVNPGS